MISDKPSLQYTQVMQCIAMRNWKSIQNDLDAHRDARIDSESIRALHCVATRIQIILYGLPVTHCNTSHGLAYIVN